MGNVEILQDTAGLKRGDLIEVTPTNQAFLDRLVERKKARYQGVKRKTDTKALKPVKKVAKKVAKKVKKVVKKVTKKKAVKKKK